MCSDFQNGLKCLIRKLNSNQKEEVEKNDVGVVGGVVLLPLCCLLLCKIWPFHNGIPLGLLLKSQVIFNPIFSEKIERIFLS